MTIKAYVPDAPELERIGPLSSAIRLQVIREDRPLPRGIMSAEFLVPPLGDHRVLTRIPAMRALRVVQAVSAGIDELNEWVPGTVLLCNARGIYDTAVAEWVVAVILAMQKQLGEFARRQATHTWDPILLDELQGQRALVVGHGSIGQAVARRLGCLGVEVTAVAASPRPGVFGAEALPSLLPTMDIVILTMPLTPHTWRLFDAKTLRQMRSGALLVNAARGEIVDTQALVAELAARRIRAALDVTDPEPLPPDHPLWDAPDVLITPHVGTSPAAQTRLYELIGDQIRRYARGEALHNVVPAHQRVRLTDRR